MFRVLRTEAGRNLRWGVLALLSISMTNLRVAEAQVESISPVAGPGANLLGNGGFEAWTLGVNDENGGSIPPDMWYPLGSTDGLFTQDAVRFRRLPVDSCFGAGRYYVRLDVDEADVYVAQQLENYLEFAGQPVTFSVDVGTTFSGTRAVIEINDGVSSTQTADRLRDGDELKRISVTHEVSCAATRLECRIYAGPTLLVDNAQAVVGKLSKVPYIPRSNPEPTLSDVPLGTVLDWWRFDNVPIPERFALCDGRPISDAGSPFNGLPTPDLRERFVRGTTDVGTIGSIGGAESASASHVHSMDHMHAGKTGPADDRVLYYIDTGFGDQRASYPEHTHEFSTGQPSTTTTGAAVVTVSTVPPYIGLLKIVRIK